MRLSSLLNTELMKLGLSAKTKNGVLKELVELTDLDSSAKQILLKTLLRREGLGSTGIGRGIAIPHCRSLLVKDPTICVGVSKRGIDFDALDGEPVHLFFLVVAPYQEPGNRYLITLGKIAQIARDVELDERFFEIKDKGDLIRHLDELERGSQKRGK